MQRHLEWSPGWMGVIRLTVSRAPRTGRRNVHEVTRAGARVVDACPQGRVS